MNNIYTVILGAGEGTRMKSRLPKILHKVAGKELISHVFESLAGIDSRKVFVVIGNGSDLVLDYLKKYKNVTAVLQKQRLGSGHALLQVRNKAKGLKGTL